LRVTSKAQLLASIEEEHSVFTQLIEAVPPKQRTAPNLWRDGWTIKDLALHMTAWEQLFLAWYRAGLRGEPVATPAAGYMWKETSRLNRDLQKRLARTSWNQAIKDFHHSYTEIHNVARQIKEAELLERRRYTWTGSTNVAAYLAANTTSHYRTGTKILRRWQRSQARAD
jgi:hypothetical protein